MLLTSAQEENAQRNGQQNGEDKAVNEDHRRLQHIHAGGPGGERNVVLFNDANNGGPARRTRQQS